MVRILRVNMVMLLSDSTVLALNSVTVFNLITAYAPISAQSSNLVVFRLQPVFFYLLQFKTCFGY